MEEIKQEKDQRPLTSIGRVLDEVEARPTIRQHPAKLAVKVSVLRREPGNGFGDGGVFVGPIVTSAGQDLRSHGVDAGVHAVSVELDFVHSVGAVRCLLNELGELRFDPRRGGAGFKPDGFQMRKLT